jgi:hypothetical protein
LTLERLGVVAIEYVKLTLSFVAFSHFVRQFFTFAERVNLINVDVFHRTVAESTDLTAEEVRPGVVACRHG